MDEFERLFGCTYEQYMGQRRAELMAVVRGNRRAGRGRNRDKVAKDLLDLIRGDAYLRDAVIFELERQDAEESNEAASWKMRTSKRSAVRTERA